MQKQLQVYLVNIIKHAQYDQEHVLRQLNAQYVIFLD